MISQRYHICIMKIIRQYLRKLETKIFHWTVKREWVLTFPLTT